MANRTTVVVGGGIVGLACAVEAQRRGGKVTLIERGDPGGGCSFGNAGIIAASEIFPLITPRRVIALPAMLCRRDAPAVIRARAFPRLLPWLIRAASTLSTRRQGAITDALAALNRPAVATWRDLLSHCGASSLLRERGMIRLIRDGADAPTLARLCDRLSSYALPAHLLSGADVRSLEPALGSGVAGGLLHESDADVGDPLTVSRALLATLIAAGGRVLCDSVISVRPGEVLARGGSQSADQILITSGLASATLLDPLGMIVPLQAERGYHLALSGLASVLSRPVTFQRESCVATPMGKTLRLAGTVEFAAGDAAPDWSRADRLLAHALPYFGMQLQASGATRWVGSRPSMPDSLPAIGRLPGAPSIGYAFGHQHLGVTQAAISARVLCDLMADMPASFDLRPYDLTRF